jgi:CHAT domain-containing protein
VGRCLSRQSAAQSYEMVFRSCQNPSVLPRDSALEAELVQNVDLQKANLVVLSGGDSQVGTRSRRDDIVALSRAFMYAGPSSVIASLWSVDDEATKQLMVAFYLGVTITRLAVARNGKQIFCSCTRITSDLFVVDGLK